MGEAPIGSQCCHAYAVARLGTLQIAVRTFHSYATQIGQRSGIQVPAEPSVHAAGLSLAAAAISSSVIGSRQRVHR
jgi:hypothetical protein